MVDLLGSLLTIYRNASVLRVVTASLVMVLRNTDQKTAKKDHEWKMRLWAGVVCVAAFAKERENNSVALLCRVLVAFSVGQISALIVANLCLRPFTRDHFFATHSYAALRATFSFHAVTYCYARLIVIECAVKHASPTLFSRRPTLRRFCLHAGLCFDICRIRKSREQTGKAVTRFRKALKFDFRR